MRSRGLDELVALGTVDQDAAQANGRDGRRDASTAVVVLDPTADEAGRIREVGHDMGMPMS